MGQYLKNKRSSAVVNNAPKLPTSSQIEYGEIAINFAKGYETISIRNNNDEIATFSSDSVLDKKYISSGAVVSAMTELSGIIEDNEYTIAQALNEQNDRLVSLEESQLDPSNFYDKTSADGRFLSLSGGNMAQDATITMESSNYSSELTPGGLISEMEGTEGDGSSISVVNGAVPEISVGCVKYGNSFETTILPDKIVVSGRGDMDFPGDGDTSAKYKSSEIIYTNLDGNDVHMYFPYEGEGTLAFTSQIPTEASMQSSGFTKNALTAYTETDPTVPAWAKQSTKPSYTASEVGAMATSERSNYLSTGATLDSVADGTTRKLSNYSLTGHTHSEYSLTGHSHTAAEVGALSTATTYFDDVEYDSSSKRINFKKNSTVIDYVDATDFIKDGMVSSVTVSNGNLVLTFNTDAGREDITLALTQIFNPSNYYDKTAADAKFLSGYTETDPTVPAWAKESTKPSYTASEVGAMATSERSNYLPTGTTLDSVADGTTRKLSNYSLAGHSHTASEVGALPTGTTLDGIADGTTRKLSNYSLTGHSHTAAEIGAMATSERNNYLPTGTTLDNVADGTTRKLSNYSLTSHTHTAAEVGALPDTTDIPTQASIANSGFTKNVGTLTGVTINGSAATVSNGNASFNIELGGSGSGLPSVSASDNGKILQVVNGQWTLVTPTVVYTGNGTPDNLLGNNGDIYLQTS